MSEEHPILLRSESAFRDLRREILSGVAVAGERLKMERLQQRFSVSSSPIREALQRLAAEGLVESDGNRGFSVATVSAADLNDLTAFRVVVECSALESAILHGDDLWEAEILAALHRLDKADRDDTLLSNESIGEWTRRHRTFHMALIAGCPSERHKNCCAGLFDQAERYRRLSIARRKVRRDSVDEHQAIAQAVLRRDIEGAVKALGDHITVTAAHAAIVLDEMPESEAAGNGAAGLLQLQHQDKGNRNAASP